MNQQSMTPEQAQAIAALSNPVIENVYANGVTVIGSSSDIAIILYRNGQPVKNLNVSFSMAKTIAEKLNFIVSQLETKTGTVFLTSDDVQKATQNA